MSSRNDDNSTANEERPRARQVDKHIKLPPIMVEKIEQRGVAQGYTFNGYIRQLIEQHLATDDLQQQWIGLVGRLKKRIERLEKRIKSIEDQLESADDLTDADE